MALTFRQKTDLDSYIKSLEVAKEERERIRGIWQSEKAAYAEYSNPIYDDTITTTEDVVIGWPPSLVSWVNVSGSGTASLAQYDEYINIIP
tara:strand:+ start:51 stop:323 length:273 start_codon:yes stop_codon:yes gene_type:complete